MKKILMATGGTGGHIYPALVTARVLKARGWEVVFIGRFGPSAKKVRKEGFRCLDIPARGLVSRSFLAAATAALGMVRAFFICALAVRKERPTLVIGFGSYSSFPTVLAAWSLGYLTMIHEQNAVPGEANKFLGHLVRRVALTFKSASGHFSKAKIVWTGCPLRPLNPSRSRADILKDFGLEEGRTTILVFGGSQGARAINDAVFYMMKGLLASTKWQLIHLTGPGAEDWHERYRQFSCPVFVSEYWENMAEAYAVADIVVGRSGAGTVTELGLLGIPAVLIPYPHAKNHQIENARVLERQNMAAIIQEKDLKGGLLRDKIFLMLEQRISREESQTRLKEDFAVDATDRLIAEIERLGYV